MKIVKVYGQVFTRENEIEVEKLKSQDFIQVNTIREGSNFLMIFRKKA